MTLLHPVKQIPVQIWPFPSESLIRIGRSNDNHVILYSAVVSRHHVELRRGILGWEAVNLGTNGTYLDGKRIAQERIIDGAVIRLARSGPSIQVRMGETALQELSENLQAARTNSYRSELIMPPTEIANDIQREPEGGKEASYPST